MSKLKVGKYRDEYGDILHVLKINNKIVTYYWTDSNGKIFVGFTKRGVELNISSFYFSDYTRIDFNGYLEKLCK